MLTYFRSLTYIFAFAAVFCLDNVTKGQDGDAREKSVANCDLGLVSLSAAADHVPFLPSPSTIYDPLNPAESGSLALYAVNRDKTLHSIDTSSICIRAIGSERWAQQLGGKIFGDAARIDLPARESTIVLRIPWANLLDAETLKRNQQADKGNTDTGFGGAILDSDGMAMKSPYWWWKAHPRGPQSPIYDRSGKLISAAVIWAEFKQDGQVVRSRPFMVVVASKLQDEQNNGVNTERAILVD